MVSPSYSLHSWRSAMNVFSIFAPHWKFKPLVLAIVAYVNNTQAHAEQVNSDQSEKKILITPPDTGTQFDLDMLKQRGIDPKIAAYFSKAPRFTHGSRKVTVLVNGTSRGIIETFFDAEGQLCFNHTLLDQANLKVPENYIISTDKSTRKIKSNLADCYDFVRAFPQTEVELRPGREEISLIVSNEALRPMSDDLSIYQRGGTAGLLNYDLIGLQNQSSNISSRYSSANTELGLNAGDWLLRSRQILTEQDGKRNFQSLYTYAQKTFVSNKSMLQTGQINISNSVFPGAAITGLQVMPDSALQGRTNGGATVEGIAQSQARVEVRQSGALIHTTLVPAGPFRLTNIQLLNGNTDLDVRIIEANGEQRNFRVAASSLAQFSYTAPGYSMAIGKVRNFDSDNMQSPIVMTTTGGWLLNPYNKLSAGLMVGSNQYQASAFTLDSRITEDTSVSLRNTLANAGQQGAKGTEANIMVSTRLTETLGASVNATRRTEGFRDLLDSTRTNEKRYTKGFTRDQYGASLSWTDPVWGGLSASYSTSTSFGGRTTEYLTGAWGKTFKYFTVSANVTHSMGNSSRSYKSRNNDGGNINFDDANGDAMYLSISIPLGNNRNIRTYANTRNGNTRFGSSFSDNSSELANYQISAESNTTDRQKDFSGNINMLPRYTSLNLGYSKSGDDSTTYSGELSGGMLLHEDGLTLSPYPLKDTFALAKVGDMLGIKLHTPSGPVWTDPWGRAVVPQLNAYQSSSVEIATKTLPRNVDIQNGFKAVRAGRGSVNKMDFAVLTTRRVLLKARDANGNFLAKGASVFNAEDQFLTTVVDSGRIFLTNDQLNEQLTVHTDDNKICLLYYSLPDKANPNVYFEAADASCKPL